MRIVLVFGCVLALANTARGADGSPAQAGTAQGAAGQSTNAAQRDVVPAGHWAYAAIAQLQADKILLGYPKGYFNGKSLSRFEFAVAIKRSVDSILPLELQPGTNNLGDYGAPPSAIHAEDLRLLRKLFLEFKADLKVIGVNWKVADDCLHTLQDNRLHSDVARALVAFASSPTDTANEFEDVRRPSWVYDSIELLDKMARGPKLRYGRILTRYEVSVYVKRCCDALSDTEDGHYVPYYKEPSTYKLSDVLELHKLVLSFRPELAAIGVGSKAVEALLSKAEENRIQAEETIDTRQATVK